MPLDRSGLTDDAVLNGRLRLLQPRRGHRFGHDAILLAAAVDARPGQHAVDLGAGVGAAGLALAARVAGLAVTLVEIDDGLAAIAGENCLRNGLADRVRSVALDVAAPPGDFAAAGLAPLCADHVLINPPFNDPARVMGSPDPARRTAYLALPETLATWIDAATRLLRPDGMLTLIYRADGLRHALDALSGYGAIVWQPIRSRPGAPPIRTIVRAAKGSAAGKAVELPAFDLNDESGRPTEAAERLLRHAEPLPWQ